MADVFISFPRPRQAVAAHLARLLECHGYSAWYDAYLRGEDFRVEIDKQIQLAKVVCVLWCKVSVSRPWVVSEAAKAFGLGKYYGFKLETCDIPSPMDTGNDFNAAEWDGYPAPAEPEWLIDIVARRTGKAPKIDQPRLDRLQALYDAAGRAKALIDVPALSERVSARAQMYLPALNAWRRDGTEESREEEGRPTTADLPDSWWTQAPERVSWKSVNDISWRPGGTHVASGDSNGDLTIYRATGRDVTSRLSLGDTVISVEWNPDARHIAAGCYDKVVVYDIGDEGEDCVLTAAKARGFSSLSWSPDGGRLAARGDASVVVWQRSKPDQPNLHAARDRQQIRDIAWTSIETLAVIEKSGELVFIDAMGAPAQRPLLERFNGVRFNCVDTNLRAGLLALGTEEGMVHILDLEKLSEVSCHASSAGACRFVDWSSDGSILLAGFEDTPCQLSLLRCKGGMGMTASLTAPERLSAAYWSPDGRSVAAVGVHAIFIWSVRDERKDFEL